MDNLMTKEQMLLDRLNETEDTWRPPIHRDDIKELLTTISSLRAELEKEMGSCHIVRMERDQLKAELKDAQEVCYQYKVAVDKASSIIKERDLLLKEVECLWASVEHTELYSLGTLDDALELRKQRNGVMEIKNEKKYASSDIYNFKGSADE